MAKHECDSRCTFSKSTFLIPAKDCFSLCIKMFCIWHIFLDYTVRTTGPTTRPITPLPSPTTQTTLNVITTTKTDSVITSSSKRTFMNSLTSASTSTFSITSSATASENSPQSRTTAASPGYMQHICLISRLCALL